METRSAKRRRLLNFVEDHQHGDTAVDHISDLPDAVLHQILSLLPINTIAQTSILSRRWRSLWSTLPDLDFSNFDGTDCSGIRSDSRPNVPAAGKSCHSLATNGADIITRILKGRDKQSNVRVLRFCASLSFSRLNGLFRTAIKHNVQELDVEVSTNDYFNFPRSVIASDSLRVFKLRSVYPGFRLPPASVMANGFRSLNCLSLALMVFYDRPSLLDMFSESSFPLLKKLNLEACFGLKHLKINCPALEDFNLESCFQLQSLDVWGAKLERLRISSCFDAYRPSWVKIAAPNLKTLIWTYNAISDEVYIDDLNSLREASVGLLREHVDIPKLQSVSTLLLGISRAHSIILESQCVDILSSNSYFACYLPPFNNLKSLELQTVFRKHNGPGLANIFKSCPILQTLIIKIINDGKIGRKDWHRDMREMIVSEEEQFWETQTQALKSFLLHLKVVRIHGFTECVNEVSLTKFLLKHGKALQEMTLWTRNCNYRDSLRRQKIKSQMMGFSRASSNAKIEYH